MIVGSLKQYPGGRGSMASGFCTVLYPSLYAQCFTQLALLSWTFHAHVQHLCSNSSMSI
jgi:hypothetical protein